MLANQGEGATRMPTLQCMRDKHSAESLPNHAMQKHHAQTCAISAKLCIVRCDERNVV